MKTRKAIVVTLDGWSANFLGPYGNTWVETSALNGLARDALLVEHAYADTIDLASSLASFWQGHHTLCPKDAAISLGERLAAAEMATHLITDDEAVARHPLAETMSSVTFAEVPASQQPAEDAALTQFGQFLASVAETIDDDSSDCVWIHAKAFAGSWDAPFELRMALTDEEEDPDPTRSVDPPNAAAISDDDPDAAWNLARSYAAQVMSVDRCLEFLLEVIDEHPVWRDALLIVTSPRSFPLGEHGTVGLPADESDTPQDSASRLHGESLHIPLFIRSPQDKSLLLRSQSIVQPACIYSTLLDWFGIPREEVQSGDDTTAQTIGPVAVGARGLMGLFHRDGDASHVALKIEQQLNRAVSQSGSELSLRTPGWFFKTSGVADAMGNAKVELYVKPDDRWEANEVADRCPEVVETMQAVLAAYVSAAKSKELDKLGELPGLLFTSTI